MNLLRNLPLIKHFFPQQKYSVGDNIEYRGKFIGPDYKIIPIDVHTGTVQKVNANFIGVWYVVSKPDYSVYTPYIPQGWITKKLEQTNNPINQSTNPPSTNPQ